MSYARMHSAEIELKAQITALVQKAAKARLEGRQRQADSQRGRTPEDERKPKVKNGKPKGGELLPPTNGMDAPTQAASQCAKVEVFTNPLEQAGASDMKVTPLGIDLAKSKRSTNPRLAA